MKTRTSRLFRLSALAAGLCLAQAALAADPGAAPSYQALPAGNLCPAAADDSRCLLSSGADAARRGRRATAAAGA